MSQVGEDGELNLVATGVPGLDGLLAGGLLPGACVLVEGVPGAGKTTLGLQFIFEGLTRFDEPGLVITFEELPEEMYRDGNAYGWDLQQAEREGKLAIICTSPEVLSDDTMASDGLFEQAVEKLSPRRVLVDSISQMAYVAGDALQQRRLVYGLRNAFRRHGLTAMLTNESQSVGDDRPVPFERYVADVVVLLNHRLLPVSGARAREIEVVKTRARPHVSGRHIACITSDGLRVLPNLPLSPLTRDVAPDAQDEFASTGSEGLDAMFGGGLIRGSTTIVAGSTGVGKTVFGMQYLCAGAQAGERGLIVSLEQTPPELIHTAHSLGMASEHVAGDGLVRVMYAQQERGLLGPLVADIADRIVQVKPQRIVIDAISSLAKAAGDTLRAQTDLSCLVSMLRTTGATCVVCDETPGVVGEHDVSGGVMISALVDNIVILKYVELGSRMRRAASILKARYVDHDKEIREYVIQQGGIELKGKFRVATGLLKGEPVRRDVDEFF